MGIIALLLSDRQAIRLILHVLVSLQIRYDASEGKDQKAGYVRYGSLLPAIEPNLGLGYRARRIRKRYEQGYISRVV